MSKYAKVLRLLRRGALPLHEVEIDAPLAPDTDETGADHVLPAQPATQHEELDREEARALVARLVGGLPLRDRLVVAARYGLLDGEASTLDEVGEALSLSRERVRQLEVQAVRGMRSVALDLWARQALDMAERDGRSFNQMLMRERDPARVRALEAEYTRRAAQAVAKLGRAQQLEDDARVEYAVRHILRAGGSIERAARYEKDPARRAALLRAAERQNAAAPAGKQPGP